ncbi:L,D-transpeptidase family protein [Longimicrobium terrae]|uniref:D-alanyl-D-alanine dipeptidase n=1 Tax=Longimicrobium terrae TaxID=1639882 RepID=A0A841GZ33_9BACT|nr:L,D-transpeptidase family protein [Longimicrobium terrae]MBB6071051.1 D-alanyl-D-alanine dipeptidase [Longimicrobium terrae]NNC29072.1 L,D-transpeptidase family protein [Longimicrobium terrae]
MRTLLPLLALAAMLPATARAQSGYVFPWFGTRQVIVSTTADWDSTAAVLQRYESDGADGWRAVGEPIAAAVGRSGLGWGEGMHGGVEDADGRAPAGPHPVKREGDGRAPAGVFPLSSAFGYADAAEASWIRMPYVQSTAAIECVDDGNSRFYNRRVDRDTVAAPDWASHEEMRREDHLYRWGVWVDHNSYPPRAMGGSCIFLHIWSAPGAPTSGCTAMAEEDLRTVLAWLDPRARPVLVQVPRAEHARMRGVWGLP